MPNGRHRYGSEPEQQKPEIQNTERKQISMKKRIEIKKLSNLKLTFYVRLGLNPERVEFFKRIIQSGQDIDPPIISDEDDVVDGRHRKAALEDLGYIETPCEIKHFESLQEKVLYALHANASSTLPPTSADINHTLQILLEARMARKDIIQQVNERTGFPPKFLQRILDDIQSNLAAARLNKAVNAVVSQNITAAEAAEQFHVKLETLQEHLAGGKKKLKKGGGVAKNFKSKAVRHYNSLVYSIGQLVSNLAKDIQDAVVAPEDTAEVVKCIKGIQRRFDRSIEDWIARLEAKGSTTQMVTTTLGRAERKAEKKKITLAQATLEKMGLPEN